MSVTPSVSDPDNFFQPPQEIDSVVALDALQHGELTLHGLLPWSSNYTFLGTVTCGELKFNFVYKPCRGERPLWDFEHSTLCRREVAAYQVGIALNCGPTIPPTVLRNGPHGPGMVQQFIHANYDAHYFTIKDNPQFQTAFQQLALFDYLVNNADRKGGHCLLDARNRIWAIDHGLTFHTEYKLKTVIWEYASQKIPPLLYESLLNLKQKLNPSGQLCRTLLSLISEPEIECLGRRLDDLLVSGKFPRPQGRRDYPYPPV